MGILKTLTPIKIFSNDLNMELEIEREKLNIVKSSHLLTEIYLFYMGPSILQSTEFSWICYCPDNSS
uniref:Uncharacterized protein n=1 Tax=Anguilla anguilla TaxID=7936 RepID=A0A0E9WF65_ANGAN